MKKFEIIKKIVDQIMQSIFIKYDYNALEEYVSEDFIMFGINPFEIIHSKKAFLSFFDGNITERFSEYNIIYKPISYFEENHEYYILYEVCLDQLMHIIIPFFFREESDNLKIYYSQFTYIEKYQDQIYKNLKHHFNFFVGKAIIFTDEFNYPIQYMSQEMKEALKTEATILFLKDLIDEQNLSEFKSIYDNCHKYSKYYTANFNFKDSEGKYVVFQNTGTPITIQNKQYILSFNLNRSHFTSSYDEDFFAHIDLLETTNELDQVGKIINAGIFKIKNDSEFTVIEGNNRFYEILGYNESEIREVFQNKLSSLIYDEDFSKMLSYDSSRLLPYQIFSTEFRIKSKNSVKWITLKGQLVSGREDVIYGIFMDMTEDKEEELSLRITQDYYRLALSKSDSFIVAYDVTSHGLKILDNCFLNNLLGVTLSQRDIREFVDENVIDKEYHNLFLELFSKIKRGAREVSLLVKVNRKGIHWLKFNFTTLFNELNRPYKAIGLVENLTKNKQYEEKYLFQEEFSKILNSDILSSAKFCISEDTLLQIFKYDDQISLRYITAYSQFYDLELSKCCFDEDKKNYISHFQIDSLLKAFYSGEVKLQSEYRRIAKNKKITWVSAEVNLFLNEDNKKVYGYIILKNIDYKKRVELNLKEKAERDFLTNTYNKHTTILLIEKILKEHNDSDLKYALFVIDIDNFKLLNDQFGHGYGDFILKQIGEKINAVCGSNDIIGRFGGDEFLVFTEVKNQNIDEKAKEIKSVFYMLVEEGQKNVQISACVGVSFSHLKDDYAMLFERSDRALYTIKHKIKNEYFIYGTSLEEKNLCQNDLQTEMIDTDYAINEILKKIGQHYRSKFTEMIYFEENDQIYRTINVWFNKPADRKNNQYFNREDIDFFKAKTNEGMPFIYEKAQQKVLVMPFKIDKIKTGSVIAYHIEQNSSDFYYIQSMTYMICSFLAKKENCEELKNFRKKTMQQEFYDIYEFLENFESFSKEYVTSLGIALFSIANVSLNADKSDIIQLTKTLEKVNLTIYQNQFNEIYRISSYEFAIVYKNLKFEDFTAEIKELKNLLKKIHENIYLGFSFSDNSVDFKNVFTNAKDFLFISRQDSLKLKNKSKENRNYQENLLFEGLKEKKFQIFLQPKFNLKTNQVDSCEALIRYFDNGSIMMPKDFIHNFEAVNLIKYIDLFVYEEACKLIRKWMDEEQEIHAISVNFSRSTIFSSNLIEEMHLIEDKYKIPKSYIEIEITESMDYLDRKLLNQIMMRIKREKYRISLDDFGSKYSNFTIFTDVNFNVIKIDKSNIDQICFNEKSQKVVKGIIDLCKQLEVDVVIEGVETFEQFTLLKDYSCDYIQGYYINKPLSVIDYEKKYIKKL